jgi:hypothetical protein
VVGRITAVVVMVVVGVVLWIHRGRRCSVTVTVVVARRRGHRGTVSVVVVAVDAGAVVVAHERRYSDDHPGFGARTIPVEADGLEVFKGGEAVELVVQLVVGHDGEAYPSVDTVERNVDGDPLDAAGTDLHVFFGVAVAVVRIEVEGDITSIGVVADVLHVVVDRDRAVVIHHHGL